MKSLVFGSTGGVGSCLCDVLRSEGHEVIGISRKDIDCRDNNLENKISNLISDISPDWIFNCIGVLGSNNDNHRDVFDANFGSNWAIVRHYIGRTDQKVQIIMMGSAVHNQPRRNSILYAASKSALHNMWQSTEDIFVNTDVNVGLIHPPRINTKMLNGRTGPSLEPDYVARVMFEMAASMKGRTLLEIGI